MGSYTLVVAPMGVKFGTEEGTDPPCQISPHRCNVSPLRGEKPQNRPLSKLNTGRFALRAMLPVNRMSGHNKNVRMLLQGLKYCSIPVYIGLPNCNRRRMNFSYSFSKQSRVAHLDQCRVRCACLLAYRHMLRLHRGGLQELIRR